MKSATKQYREDMKFPFRNKWGLEMYIGLIREKFQANAFGETKEPVSYLSNNYNSYLYKNTPVETRVATFEENMFKANGDPIFSDKSGLSLKDNYYGLVSDEVSDSGGNLTFTVTFKSKTKDKGLKGLSLTFLENYPTEFNIKALSDGVQIFSKNYANDSFDFKTADVFGDYADELILTVKKMNKPFVRFRLGYVLFGIGAFFGNKDFVASSGSYKEAFHPCSIELPTKEFSLTLDNMDDIYNIDKSDSLIRLADIGQDVSFHTTYTHDDGSIEILPGEKLELASFDTSNHSLKMKAVDFLRNENSEVVIDKPEQYPEGATLYDMVQIVKNNLQNDTFTVTLDNALKEVPIEYTHIDTTCKDALLMIAGAARCILELNEKGVTIRRVAYDKTVLSGKSNDTAPYSSFLNFFEQYNSSVVASFENDKVKADGNSIFASKTPSKSVKVGYVSESLCDENGNFEVPPEIEIISEGAMSVDYIFMRFNSLLRNVTIQSFYDDALIETIHLKDIGSSEINLSKLLVSFNKLVIKVESLYTPYRRVYADYIGFERRTYNLNKSLCTREPVMKIEDTIRNIIVYYRHFENVIDPETNETVEKEIEGNIKLSCNRTGSDIEYTNPFITSENVARKVGEWLKEYYTTQIFYNVDVVGDPTIQVNDIIKIPNNYNDNLLTNIEGNEISFRNGGIRGKMRVRRKNDAVVITKNKLDSRRLY